MTAPSSGPNSLVLYADDDPDDREFVRRAFEQNTQHIELIEFANGRDLLTYVKNQDARDQKPCLIILDINMPIVNGKEALVELRKVEGFEDTPVVLFTTST